MRRFGGDRVKGFMEWAGFDEDTPLEHGMVSKVIENAQTKVEAYHFDIRKHWWTMMMWSISSAK